MENESQGGRPTDYKPEYCQMLVTHMGQGFSFESFAADVDTTRSTLYYWEKNFPEFSDAKKRGREKCLKALEAAGLGLTFGQIKGNSTSWIFQMKNIAGWKDTHVIEFDGEVEYTLPDNLSAKHLNDTNKPQAD